MSAVDVAEICGGFVCGRNLPPSKSWRFLTSPHSPYTWQALLPPLIRIPGPCKDCIRENCEPAFQQGVTE